MKVRKVGVDHEAITSHRCFCRILTIVAFANNASAYSHPSLGRFISRDPGPARVGSGGIATGGHFVQRDPILEYAGGMNLYEYTHSRPVSLIDPDGLLPVPGPEDMLLINHYEGLSRCHPMERTLCSKQWI